MLYVPLGTASTVSGIALLLTPPAVAVSVVVPAAMPVTKPLVAFTVASAGAELE